MTQHFTLSKQCDPSDEQSVIEQAQQGNREAVDRLVRQHQQFVYNVALKLAGEPYDAADLTQEAFLKVLTRLPQFKFNSSFRTWLYRIVMNHFLNSRRNKTKIRLHSFEDLAEMADHLYKDEQMSEAEQVMRSEEIRLVRNKYMSSALLCLDRAQRMVLILGFVFRVPSANAAPLLGLRPENFRKQLQRAKEELFKFMDNKCGLMNPKNPCRCFKKAKGFGKDGRLNAKYLKFDSQLVQTIESVVDEKNGQLDDLMEGRYRQLFVTQPGWDTTEGTALIEGILTDPDIVAIYQLK
jgi:RNA polymerase sigma factor (sigma-70 family)